MSQSKSRNSHQKRELKMRIASKKGEKCQNCDKRMPWRVLTLDHIIPLDAGGSWSIDNLQLLCYSCNQEKGNSTFIDLWSTL